MTLYDLLNTLAPKASKHAVYLRKTDAEHLDTEEEKAVYDAIGRVLYSADCLRISGLSVKGTQRRKGRFTYNDQDARAYLKSEISDDDFQKILQLDLSLVPDIYRDLITLAMWLRNDDLAAGAWYAEYHFRKFQNMQDPDEWLDPWQDIEKAVVAASDLGEKALEKKYITEVESKLIRIDGRDKMFLSINLIELLCVYKKKADYRLYLDIVDKLFNGDSNVIRFEDILNLRISLSMLIGDNGLIIDSHEKAVREYERLGYEEQDNLFRAVDYYKKALFHYEEILKRKKVELPRADAARAETSAPSQKDDPSQIDATKAKIAALRQKLSDTEKAAVKQMPSFGYKIDVSDIMKQQDIYFAGLDFHECIILLCALLRFRTKDEIKRTVNEDAKSGSLSMFVRLLQLS